MIFNLFALRFERLAEDVILVLVAQLASFLKRLRMMSLSPLQRSVAPISELVQLLVDCIQCILWFCSFVVYLQLFYMGMCVRACLCVCERLPPVCVCSPLRPVCVGTTLVCVCASVCVGALAPRICLRMCLLTKLLLLGLITLIIIQQVQYYKHVLKILFYIHLLSYRGIKPSLIQLHYKL